MTVLWEDCAALFGGLKKKKMGFVLKTKNKSYSIKLTLMTTKEIGLP